MGESQTGQTDLSSPRAQTVSAQDGGRIVTWHQYSLPARPWAPTRPAHQELRKPFSRHVLVLQNSRRARDLPTTSTRHPFSHCVLNH